MEQDVVGVRPSPRALLLDVSDELAEEISDFFPTSRRISWIGDVEQREWDVLVTTGDVPNAVATHIFVLACGDSFGRPAEVSTPKFAEFTVCSRCLESVATEFAVPKDVPDGVRRLVYRDLLPGAQSERVHRCLGEEIRFPMQMPPAIRPDLAGQPIKGFRPFLKTAQGAAIAGSFMRRDAVAECWALPDYAQLALWVPVALRAWHEINPHRIPLVDRWRDRPRWLTALELRASAALAEHDEARAEFVRQWEAKRERLVADLQQAEGAAVQRRLLTVQGDDLVAVVAECLQALGFDVRNMDDEFPPTDRREDLRVTVPSDPSWMALVEVRGYKGGASVNDLLRLTRFEKRFIQETGTAPSATWYVASQHVGSDPDLRQPILASNPLELATFAEDGGLAIDTSVLFRLWREVQLGRRLAPDVRAMLVGARGRLELETRDGVDDSDL